MDKLDENIKNILTKEIDKPQSYYNTIRYALDNKQANKRDIFHKGFNFVKVAITGCLTIVLTTGIVFAAKEVYKNIWKEPEKVDGFYGENGEYNEDEEYGIWHSKNIDISSKNVISEDEARIKFNKIFKKFGYEGEVIKLIELIDNPSDDGLFYRATTENKFMLELDAKDTRNFKIFTDIAYKDIDKYRGTQEEIEKTIENICKKYEYDLSKYNHKEIKFNIAQSVFEESLLKHTYVENSPDNANIWEVKYNKEYNGVINKYEEITIGIVPEINELYYLIYTDKAPENTDIVVDKEKAKEIAIEKEKQLNIGYNIKDTSVELDIVKINGYAHIRENNFKQYYEQTHTANYPLDKIQYYRVEERIRQVWKITLEFEQSKNSKYKETSFTYFIDATTGEVVGGM